MKKLEKRRMSRALYAQFKLIPGANKRHLWMIAKRLGAKRPIPQDLFDAIGMQPSYYYEGAFNSATTDHYVYLFNTTTPEKAFRIVALSGEYSVLPGTREIESGHLKRWQ